MSQLSHESSDFRNLIYALISINFANRKFECNILVHYCFRFFQDSFRILTKIFFTLILYNCNYIYGFIKDIISYGQFLDSWICVEQNFVVLITGYSLGCPAGCENSLIEETHHFQILGRDQYLRLLHFGAEEYTMSAGGILCPQPGCGNGLIPDPSCRRIQCTSGCEVCLQH